MRKAVIACSITALAVGAGTASASVVKLITSKDIADGTIQNRDIQTGAISMNRLSPGVQALLTKVGKAGVNGAGGTNGHDGSQGSKGDTGSQGAAGAKGDKGDKAPTLDDAFSFTSTTQNGPDGDYTANNQITLTNGGVNFGPYADGNTSGGSLRWDGMNGKTLGDITNLLYTAKYSTKDGSQFGVPYLRVFLEGGHDVIFSPNTQPTLDIAQNVFHNWNVTQGSVRYDDDGGFTTDVPWADVLAAHGGEKITGIKVSVGFTGDHDLRALLSDLTINDQHFQFSS